MAAVIVSALSGIYRTALYHYAADGQVPGEFDGIDFQDAFKPRRSIPGSGRRFRIGRLGLAGRLGYGRFRWRLGGSARTSS